jgi:hypothetical protein
VEECGPCSVFASFTLAFALQLRKKHGKTSDRVRKTSVTVQYTYYQKHLHVTKPTHTHTTKQYKTTTVQIKTKYSRKVKIKCNSKVKTKCNSKVKTKCNRKVKTKCNIQ